MREDDQQTHDEAVFEAFAAPNRKARYLGLLKSEKGRGKLRDALAHFRDFDARFAEPFVPSNASAAEVARELRARGAPDRCHVLCENTDLDGREFDLDHALKSSLGGGFGTLISCVPGKLGFYEGEGQHERLLLVR